MELLLENIRLAKMCVKLLFSLVGEKVANSLRLRVY